MLGRRALLRLVCALVGVAAVGCSDTAEQPAPGPDVTAGPDVRDAGGTDGTPDVSPILDSGQDTGGEDIAADAGPDGTVPDGVAPDAIEEPPVDCEKTPGAPACPCDESEDCDTGWCLPTSAGLACASFCDTGCDEGFECRPVSSPGAGADVSHLCVQRTVYLCMPCTANKDCLPAGYAGEDECVDYGDEGSFCGVACESDAQCPTGFECSEGGQCVSVTGQCACEPLHIDFAALTDCGNTNEHGSCAGQRQCAEGGLTACDAGVPEAEVCDNQDNNCSGTKDDIPLTECDVINQFGTCKGTLYCQGGTSVCQGEPAKSEVCDGLDNDCNGTPDDGYPNSDTDALANCIDPDDDNDSILDDADNCPIHPNNDQQDTDGDGKGDACDSDDDGDGSPDNVDCEPLLKFVYPFAEELCDGVDNDCDGATDEGSCDDTNACTDDVCNPVSGCEHAYNEKPCNDGNFCTDNDKCAFGQCAGNFITCDDQNPCTSDSCDAGEGCKNVVNSLPCSDDNACTEGDQCTGGSCLPGTLVSCEDGSPCTLNTCSKTQGCETSFLTNPCSDGNPCTAGDTCVGGECLGDVKDCDDGDPCTTDSCDQSVLGGCVNAPASGASCDDGLECTVDDACSAGQCTGTDVGCDCTTDADCEDDEDGNLCNGTLFCDTSQVPFKCKVEPETVVACTVPEGFDAACVALSCDGETGLCTATPANIGGACNDGDACTESDVCSGGVCAGTPKTCVDGNLCTSDDCDAELGCVFSPVAGFKACDDGDDCTTQDACEGGFCLGPVPVTCNDNNPCTDDFCDGDAGGCVYQNNNKPCSDFDACTTGDQCSEGSCQPGAPVSCSNGDACDGQETCDKTAGCQSGPPLSCDDGIPCTADSCSPLSGCKHLPDDTLCNDGQICNGLEECDAIDGCVGQHLPNGTGCDDGNPCTDADQCLGGQCIGQGLVCDDDNPCTTDSCDGAGTGCVFTKVADQTVCNDGDACTQGDACADGLCLGATPVVCSDGNPCTDDACDSLAGCQFTDNTEPCADGDPCTVDDECASGSCVGQPLDCSGDGDGDPCTVDDQCVAGVCEGTPMDCTDLDDQCNEGACDGGFCFAVPLDQGCDDGDACTHSDSCEGGSCVGEVLDCSDFDGPCSQGTCEDGQCVEQSIACGVTSIRWITPAVALSCDQSTQTCVRGAAGQSAPVGPAEGPSGLRVRWGFHAR